MSYGLRLFMFDFSELSEVVRLDGLEPSRLSPYAPQSFLGVFRLLNKISKLQIKSTD